MYEEDFHFSRLSVFFLIPKLLPQHTGNEQSLRFSAMRKPNLRGCTILIMLHHKLYRYIISLNRKGGVQFLADAHGSGLHIVENRRLCSFSVCCGKNLVPKLLIMREMEVFLIRWRIGKIVRLKKKQGRNGRLNLGDIPDREKRGIERKSYFITDFNFVVIFKLFHCTVGPSLPSRDITERSLKWRKF